ncbi:MAG: EutN/CcmL family microcompartment protein [Planctomycetaceae bacterium]|jgi:ethanolamine utilization protein EutN|nr:EutN/CcmL family microcompartment protein [Planctomycetaceae bacterium]
MLNALVIGTATASLKHESLAGRKMLVAQPVGAKNCEADGEPLIVLDTFGAGVGDYVIISNDGKYAREIVGTKASPARWMVIGIVDQVKS